MPDQIQHDQTRFLAASGLGTDYAANEFMRAMSDDERQQVATLLAETRAKVAKLKQEVEARNKTAPEPTEG